MIKYNLNTINDWNFGDDNITKVYYDNAVCYYKVFKSLVEPQYRTLATATTCVGYDKYTLEEYQVSFDEGETWTTTATSATTLIEANSEDCGYVPPFDEYEYIKSQSGNYHYTFNTGFYPTTAHTIEIKMELSDQSLDWGRILGWSDCTCDTGNNTAGQFRFCTVTSNCQIIVRCGSTNGIQYRPNIGTGLTLTVTLPLSAQSGTYASGGTTPLTLGYNYNSTFPNSIPYFVPMHIFGIGFSGDTKYAANCKIYYVKIWNGSTLVKHYVASSKDGSPCFYEKIDGDYILDTWTGSNHGTLTLGSKINT